MSETFDLICVVETSKKLIEDDKKTKKTNISSSALYKYLGWTKSRRAGTNATAGVYKNGVPLLLYLDTFKNFFANTQEDKFYMISNVGSEPTIKAGFGGTASTDYKLPATKLNVIPKTYSNHEHLAVLEISDAQTSQYSEREISSIDLKEQQQKKEYLRELIRRQ